MWNFKHKHLASQILGLNEGTANTDYCFWKLQNLSRIDIYGAFIAIGIYSSLCIFIYMVNYFYFNTTKNTKTL